MAQEHRDTDSDTTIYRPASIAVLWTGVLLTPLAFICGVIALYALSAPTCAQRHELIIHSVHGITAAIGLIGIAAAWSTNRTTHGGTGAAGIGPGVRFLALASIGSSVLFELAMLVQWGISFAYLRCV